MEMKQQIEQCLLATIGQYYSFEQEEMEEVVEKMYNLFNDNKQEEEITTNTKRRTNFSISTLNTMKKEDLKNLCTDFGIKTGNLKKNDLILLIVDYQRNIENEQENDSDISSLTDVEEDNSIAISVTTSIKK